MSVHNMDQYVREGFEYKSSINRIVIEQTSSNTYDLTLKSKNIFLSAFHSFAHLEIEAKDGVPVASVLYYQHLLQSIAITMSVLISMLILSGSFCVVCLQLIVWIVLIACFKIHGYRELRKINAKILSGEPIQ